MNIQIHYEEEGMPKTYIISAVTREEMERALNQKKKKKGLQDNQFTIEMLNTGI